MKEKAPNYPFIYARKRHRALPGPRDAVQRLHPAHAGPQALEPSIRVQQAGRLRFGR
jgi:hypothetical protein